MTDPMTSASAKTPADLNVLAEMRARVDAATEGPWDWRESSPGLGSIWYHHAPHGADYTVPGCGHCGENDAVYETHDGAFIAASRTDMPKLLDAVDAVVALHRPDDGLCGCHESGLCPEAEVLCEACEDLYPCPTIRAVTDNV